MSRFARDRAEVEAERIEALFADVSDSAVRDRRLVELLLDFEEAVRAETIADLIRRE